MSGKRYKSKIISGRHIFAVLIAVFALAGGYAAYNLITTEQNYNEARNEYSGLRIHAPYSEVNPGRSDNYEPEEAEQETVQETRLDLASINPDYIGWILIEETGIDYPMVQGADNTKYLNTTFTGERNPSGTIFMDSHIINGFSGFAILHGHNMKDGSMFAGLHSLLDSDLLSDEMLPALPDIIIYTSDNNMLLYQIFAVKLTDIDDEVFQLPEKEFYAMSEYFAVYGFTGEVLQESIDILVLSTCTNGGRNERLIVLASRNRE